MTQRAKDAISPFVCQLLHQLGGLGVGRGSKRGRDQEKDETHVTGVFHNLAVSEEDSMCCLEWVSQCHYYDVAAVHWGANQARWRETHTHNLVLSVAPDYSSPIISLINVSPRFLLTPLCAETLSFVLPLLVWAVTFCAKASPLNHADAQSLIWSRGSHDETLICLTLQAIFRRHKTVASQLFLKYVILMYISNVIQSMSFNIFEKPDNKGTFSVHSSPDTFSR